VANPAREAWGGGFYRPPRESSRLGVRNPDMSDNHLWNLAKKPDKPGVTRDKAERLDISGLGVEHVWVRSLEPG
jgi:hypothetical protein